MDSDSFMKLVADNDGFEFVIGFRDDVDHYIGGKGNKYWYLVQKGNNQDYYVGTYNNGAWSDMHYVAKSHNIKKSETVSSGTTIAKIVDRAYFYQEKTVGKKGTEVEKDGDESYINYSFGFGEKAVRVNKKYGVSTYFSDINNVAEGYHLRDIMTGKDVDKPKES